MQRPEPDIYDHEDRIITLEENVKTGRDEINSVKEDIKIIHEDLRERYARIDENNKNLRELSQSQIIQNTKILDSVLSGNHEAAKRQDEIKTAAIKSRADIWLKAIGSGGIFYLVIDMLLRLLN